MFYFLEERIYYFHSLINLTTSFTSSIVIEGPMGRLNSSSAILSVIGKLN